MKNNHPKNKLLHINSDFLDAIKSHINKLNYIQSIISREPATKTLMTSYYSSS